MQQVDARTLSPAAQEALRKRAVAAVVIDGMKQCAVAQAFGVSANIVSQWMKRYRAHGEQALNARKKGPKAGTRTLLTPRQAETMRRLIIDKCPDQLKLPFFLWTREAVRELIQRKCEVTVSVNKAGQHVKARGVP